MTRHRLVGDKWIPLSSGSIPSAPPIPRVREYGHVSRSLPRAQGKTAAERAADAQLRGYPRVNDLGQPVFLTKREIENYSARTGHRHTYDRT